MFNLTASLVPFLATAGGYNFRVYYIGGDLYKVVWTLKDVDSFEWLFISEMRLFCKSFFCLSAVTMFKILTTCPVLKLFNCISFAFHGSNLVWYSKYLSNMEMCLSMYLSFSCHATFWHHLQVLFWNLIYLEKLYFVDLKSLIICSCLFSWWKILHRV